MATRTKTIKLCTINICGFSDRSKITLDKYVNDKGFDIVSVLETDTSDKDKLKLTNMKMTSDSNKSKNKGAALYLRNKFTLSKLKELNEVSKELDASWGLGVINNKRYLIGSVYVKLGYSHAIEEVIQMLNKAYTLKDNMKAAGIIFTGDFNARHISWGDSRSNQYGQKLVDMLDTSKFSIITSSTPTFLATNGSSVIDLTIMTNDMVEKVESCKTDINIELFSGAPFRGHVPLITTFNTEGSVTSRDTITKINLDKVCWKKWTEDLEKLITNKENYLSNLSDPNELGEFIDKAIQTVTNQHGEMKTVSVHSKPYWTPELETLCQEMRKTRTNYCFRNTDDNERKMKDAKEVFDEARKRQCREFILEKTKNLNSAQRRKFWKEFNQIFKKKSDQTIEPLINSDGKLVTDNASMEEVMFGTFFEGHHLKDANFDDAFYVETNRIYAEIMQADIVEENEAEGPLKDLNSDITAAEIKAAIRQYNADGKSSDKEEFNPKMFTHLGDNILKYINKLANLCLNQGKWIWNKSEVIFLRKGGKETYDKPGSYRPISISSYIGKLIEKILAQRIQKYLNILGINDEDQEGFKAAHNTIRYLNRLVLGINSDKQKKLTSICLFIDFEKAFDSVWKKGLIVKLHKLGINGKILYLIDDFLMNRKVTININGIVGNIRQSSDIGLPQGSALSPLLFRIYVMDLAAELSNREDVSIFKFADDGTIKATATSTPECLKTFNMILKTVSAWSKKWRMMINCQPDKTEVIAFNTAEKDQALVPSSFKLGENKINRVHHTKALGLIIDENLDFLEHSKAVYKKLMGIWIMISQYSNRHWGLQQHVTVQIIKTLWLPTLLYAGHIWINKLNMIEINKLFYKILKSTVGAVFNIRQSLAEIILGIPPLHITIEMNRIKHYLKLQMSQIPEDRLKEYIRKELTSGQTGEVHRSMKQVQAFLKWKSRLYPDCVNEDDKLKIESGLNEELLDVTPETCKYTKGMVNKFIEYKWQRSIQNEFQLEGFANVPRPKCSPLPISPRATREVEVLTMSIMYPNNLLNNFLHRVNSEKFPSPLCSCGEDIQTAQHVMFRCNLVEDTLKAEAHNLLVQAVGEHEAEIDCSIPLLNASRNKRFMEITNQIINSQVNNLNIKIEL